MWKYVVTVEVNVELVWSCQVYDRLGQNDVTVELVSQEFAAVYSVAAADEVFSSSAEYDALRRVIYVTWRRLLTACCMCVCVACLSHCCSCGT